MIESDYFSGVAVVTGGGSGLGASMVQRFADAGMAVAVLDINAEQAEVTAEQVRVNGGKAKAWGVNVADHEALHRVAGEVAASLGNCTVLCANVGVQQLGAIDKLTRDEWRWVLDVNVTGVVDTVSAFLPQLRQVKGNRHIVITSSSAAYSPGIRMAAYTTSKYAITGYAETLRMELADEGIGVSILFPSGMITTHLQSSIQARPEALGAVGDPREDIDAMMQSRKVDRADHVATAEHATRHLLEDLMHNQRYIITHGYSRDTMEANFAELMAAHDRAQQ